VHAISQSAHSATTPKAFAWWFWSGARLGLMAARGEPQAANVDKFKQVAEWEERASFYQEEVGTHCIRPLLPRPSAPHPHSGAGGV
jgi:hypothetical protein